MAYTKTNWQERIANNKNRFIASGAVSGEVFLTNVPTNVTQAGTPFSVESMNKIEEGIFAAHKAIDDLLEQEPFGYLIPFEFEPTALELAMWRCLPLSGQMVLIAQYQRLCDRKYCGNAANDTADWWYKTSDPEGTVRDVNGAYMRVLDRRGLFGRAAGQNSKYRMANDAPYDGMSIGAFQGDRIQDFRMIFSRGYEPSTNDSRIIMGSGDAGSWDITPRNLYGYEIRTGHETAPASISYYPCIKY